MLCSLSTKLGEEEMGAIKSLESEMGRPILAFSCHPVQAAEISADHLSKIQALESKLGVSLVAVNA
jgi:hypothetical protein